MAAARAAMCMPCAWRASRSSAPAVAPGAAGAGTSSVIEAPPVERDRLGRLREPVAQLGGQLLLGRPVPRLVLDADRQPQRLRVGLRGLGIDAPDVEAGPLGLAAAVEHFG